jgi:hypothetical protein
MRAGAEMWDAIVSYSCNIYFLGLTLVLTILYLGPYRLGHIKAYPLTHSLTHSLPNSPLALLCRYHFFTAIVEDIVVDNIYRCE